VATPSVAEAAVVGRPLRLGGMQPVPAGQCSAAVLGTTACQTGEGAAAEHGTVALATQASGLLEGRAPAASWDPSSTLQKKAALAGKVTVTHL
jgi:hypothetical protein